MKRILSIFTILMLFVVCTSAHADIWGNRHGQPAPFEMENQELSSSNRASTGLVAPDDILSNLATIIGALGTKEGAYYDFKRNEFENYAAATLITFDPVPVSIDLGMLNVDGVALTANYNIGDSIPVENVPVMKYLKYLYLGAGVGGRFVEPDDNPDAKKSWEYSLGVSALFKFTY